ncbi:MAG: alpha/beta fold hydrolase [Planctomycetota bacterium]
MLSQAVADEAAAKRWRDLYPFESHWLDLGEDRLHYLDVGPDVGPAAAAGADFDSTPTLLFVHGNPTWSFHWRRLIEQQRGTHRCVAIDHIGCGLSSKPQRALRLADRIHDLVRLIDTLDLKRVTLVAQDWGGAIGLGAMLERQALLERIVLFNTGAFPPPSIPRRIAVCRTPLVGKLALQGGNLFSLAALRMTLARRARLAPSVEAGYLAPYDTWPNRRAVREFVVDIPRSGRHPTWTVLRQIEARLPELAELPIKLIWGLRDWCFTPACLERFEKHWPAADVTRLSDVGHWVVEDAPEEATDRLQEFLAKNASPEPLAAGA